MTATQVVGNLSGGWPPGPRLGTSAGAIVSVIDEIVAGGWRDSVSGAARPLTVVDAGTGTRSDGT